MTSDAPPFWYEDPGLKSFLVSPISWIYGAVATRQMKNAKREELEIPVLCIGNFTVGGTGKTPTAITIAKAAMDMNLKPGFLTRGYGGAVSEPTLVDIDHHGAKYVGDEPLLLAAVAPTIVSPDRVKGAQKLIDHEVDIIIMDDGFQSAHLCFDYALLVVDAYRGLGNGKVIPAGPVRAPLKRQMLYVDALAVVGDGTAADQLIRIAARSAKPVYPALLKPTEEKIFKKLNCLAFAGIGNPQKFFKSLRDVGANVEMERAYPDHHFYADDEIKELMELAEKHDLTLVTTAKDHVRIKSGLGISKELADCVMVLDIDMAFDDFATSKLLINRTIENYKKRRLKNK